MARRVNVIAMGIQNSCCFFGIDLLWLGSVTDYFQHTMPNKNQLFLIVVFNPVLHLEYNSNTITTVIKKGVTYTCTLCTPI